MYELTGCDVKEANNETDKENSFIISFPNDLKKKQILIYADNEQDMRDWMQRIKVSI